jgi:hypothetical protein
MTSVAGAGRPMVFDLFLSDAPDALLRVLDLFAVQGARLGAVEMRRVEGRMRLRVEVEALPDPQAARLSGRLAGSLFTI